MKKLMIAAAIVCAAVASQAASFTWTTATAFGPAAANLLVPGAYAPDSSVVQNRLIMETTNRSIVWTALMDISSSLGDDSIEFSVTPGMTSVQGTGTSAKIANGTDTDPVTATVTTVLVGKYKVGDVDYTITSDPLLAEGSFGEMTTLQFDASAVKTWTVATAAVPEPTSGLLLLLGVAGLALRRRRA